MNQTPLKEDGTPYEPFNEEAFLKIYEALPKKVYEKKGVWPREERVQMNHLWSLLEKEAAEDGVLFQPFRQLDLPEGEDPDDEN